MTNLQRLLLEIKSINLQQDELSIYLQENGLNPHDEYQANSLSAKRNIYRTALSILQSIANNPQNLKNYRVDDMTISDFADNIQSRIDQLDRKIRTMPIDELADSNYFMLFNS